MIRCKIFQNFFWGPGAHFLSTLIFSEASIDPFICTVVYVQSLHLGDDTIWCYNWIHLISRPFILHEKWNPSLLCTEPDGRSLVFILTTSVQADFEKIFINYLLFLSTTGTTFKIINPTKIHWDHDHRLHSDSRMEFLVFRLQPEPVDT